MVTYPGDHSNKNVIGLKMTMIEPNEAKLMMMIWRMINKVT